MRWSSHCAEIEGGDEALGELDDQPTEWELGEHGDGLDQPVREAESQN